MINHIARANASTVDLVPVANITAPAIAMEGVLAVIHTRDAVAGQLTSANAFNTVVDIEKTTLSDTLDVGDVVNINVGTQKQATSGTAIGHCVKASSATDVSVRVALNTNL